MSDKKYNGWTNYATWRVNLEMFDGMSDQDITGKRLNSPFDLRDALKEMAENMIEESGAKGLALDYALAFLSDVNWLEIAEGMIDTYAENEDESAA